MYGNCFTFAIYDFLKNGGELCIEFWPGYRAPHFSVQRNEKRYDFEIVRMILAEFWYDGDMRVSEAKTLDHYKCKRYLLATKRVHHKTGA
jgi:hypothetical protein